MKTLFSRRELTLAQKEALQMAKQERAATIHRALTQNVMTRNNSLGRNTPPINSTAEITGGHSGKRPQFLKYSGIVSPLIALYYWVTGFSA